MTGVQTCALPIFPEEDQGEISGLSRSVSNLGSSLGAAIAGAVLVSMLISGITSLTVQSTVLTADQQQRIRMALTGDVSAMSDTQVRSALQGEDPAVVEEVRRINAQARNRALAWAQVIMVVIGFTGLIAALLLPSESGKSRQAASVPQMPQPKARYPV